VRIIGPELILNKIYDEIDFNQIPEKIFRHLVLSRVIYPGSKLRTIEYLSRHHQKHYSSSTVYRFMDKLGDPLAKSSESTNSEPEFDLRKKGLI